MYTYHRHIPFLFQQGGKIISTSKYDGLNIRPKVKWSDPGTHLDPSFDNIIQKDYAIVLHTYPHILCVDIDGKNGGYETLASDRLLQSLDDDTLIETSKSGTGEHRFYLMHSDSKVRITGRFKGVDILSSGILYNTTNMRHNNKLLAYVSPPMQMLIDQYVSKPNRIVTTKTITPAMKRKLEQSLTPEQIKQGCSWWCANKIEEGNRNQKITMYAIALKKGGNQQWQEHVRHAAETSDIPDEAENIIVSINQSKY